METMEDETEIVLVEKAMLLARNGEIVVGKAACTINFFFGFLAEAAMTTMTTINPIHPKAVVMCGKPFAVDNGVR
jgi:hypothetical protein